MNRRYFIGGALAAASTTTKKAVAANDKVNIGMIGVGGRGRGLTRTFVGIEDANVMHICDADQASLKRAQGVISKAGGKKPKETDDMRRLFDDPRNRRRRRRHARPLARSGGHSRVQRRQGRLCREAALAQYPRRPSDRRRRTPQQE